MWPSNPRSLLLRALLLDSCGQALIIWLISASSLSVGLPLEAGVFHGQGGVGRDSGFKARS